MWYSMFRTSKYDVNISLYFLNFLIQMEIRNSFKTNQSIILVVKCHVLSHFTFKCHVHPQTSISFIGKTTIHPLFLMLFNIAMSCTSIRTILISESTFMRINMISISIQASEVGNTRFKIKIPFGAFSKGQYTWGNFKKAIVRSFQDLTTHDCFGFYFFYIVFCDNRRNKNQYYDCLDCFGKNDFATPSLHLKFSLHMSTSSQSSSFQDFSWEYYTTWNELKISIYMICYNKYGEFLWSPIWKNLNYSTQICSKFLWSPIFFVTLNVIIS